MIYLYLERAVLSRDMSARDTAAFNALRRAMIDLQAHILRECQ